MIWHKQTLKKYGKEIVSSTILFLVIVSSISLWYFILGKSFEWREINPLAQPSIFVRVFYSALTFFTLGAFLYNTKFYKVLRWLSGDMRSFKKAKAFVWLVLLGIMFFYVVPIIINLLNLIISFAYNILNLVLYLFPPVGIPIIVFIIYWYICKRFNI